MWLGFMPKDLWGGLTGLTPGFETLAKGAAARLTPEAREARAKMSDPYRWINPRTGSWMAGTPKAVKDKYDLAADPQNPYSIFALPKGSQLPMIQQPSPALGVPPEATYTPAPEPGRSLEWMRGRVPSSWFLPDIIKGWLQLESERQKQLKEPQKMQGGGPITGGRPEGSLAQIADLLRIEKNLRRPDNRLIAAQPGEFVLSKPAVDLMGQGNLDIINEIAKGMLPQMQEGGNVPRMQGGGQVPGFMSQQDPVIERIRLMLQQLGIIGPNIVQATPAAAPAPTTGRPSPQPGFYPMGGAQSSGYPPVQTKEGTQKKSAAQEAMEEQIRKADALKAILKKREAILRAWEKRKAGKPLSAEEALLLRDEEMRMGARELSGRQGISPEEMMGGLDITTPPEQYKDLTWRASLPGTEPAPSPTPTPVPRGGRAGMAAAGGAAKTPVEFAVPLMSPFQGPNIDWTKLMGVDPAMAMNVLQSYGNRMGPGLADPRLTTEAPTVPRQMELTGLLQKQYMNTQVMQKTKLDLDTYIPALRSELGYKDALKEQALAQATYYDNRLQAGLRTGAFIGVKDRKAAFDMLNQSADQYFEVAKNSNSDKLWQAYYIRALTAMYVADPGSMRQSPDEVIKLHLKGRGAGKKPVLTQDDVKQAVARANEILTEFGGTMGGSFEGMWEGE